MFAVMSSSIPKPDSAGFVPKPVSAEFLTQPKRVPDNSVIGSPLKPKRAKVPMVPEVRLETPFSEPKVTDKTRPFAARKWQAAAGVQQPTPDRARYLRLVDEDRELQQVTGLMLETLNPIRPTSRPPWISEHYIKATYSIEGPIDSSNKRNLVCTLIEIEKKLCKPSFEEFAKEARPYLEKIIKENPYPLPELGCFLFYQDRDHGIIDLTKSPLLQRIHEIRDNLVALDLAHAKAFGNAPNSDIPAAKTLYFLRALVRLFVTPSGIINPAGGATVSEIIKHTPHKLAPNWVVLAQALCTHFDEGDRVRPLFRDLLAFQGLSELDQVMRFEWQLPDDTVVVPQLRTWVVLKTILHPYTQAGYGNCYAFSALGVLQYKAPSILVELLCRSIKTGKMPFEQLSLPANLVIQDRMRPYCTELQELSSEGSPEESTPLQLILEALPPSKAEAHDGAQDVIQEIVRNQAGLYRLASLSHPLMAELLIATLEHHSIYHSGDSKYENNFSLNIEKLVAYVDSSIIFTEKTQKQKFCRELTTRLNRIGLYSYRGASKSDFDQDPHSLSCLVFGKRLMFRFPSAVLKEDQCLRFKELILFLDKKTQTVLVSKEALAALIWEEVLEINTDRNAPSLEDNDLAEIKKVLFHKEKWYNYLTDTIKMHNDALSKKELEGSDALFIPHGGGFALNILSSLGLTEYKPSKLPIDPVYGILPKLRELHTMHHEAFYSIGSHNHDFTCIPSLCGELLTLSEEDFKAELERATFTPMEERLDLQIPHELLKEWEVPKSVCTWREAYTFSKNKNKGLYYKVDKHFFKLPVLTKENLADIFVLAKHHLTDQALEDLHTFTAQLAPQHAHALAHKIHAHMQIIWGVTLNPYKLYQTLCTYFKMPKGVFFASPNFKDWHYLEEKWTKFYVYLPDPFGKRLIPFICSGDKMLYDRPQNLDGCSLLIANP
jgi:hypothetical protein